jgi:hypothetical protein
MGGGLMQLVAYGAQDIYITGNPQITFFKVVYRRHTNFSMESIRQNFNGTVDFGKKVSCTIAKNGDLLHRIYLQIDLPEVSITAGSNRFRWLNWLGHILVKNVDIEIGGQRIDKHYGDWFHIWNELTQEPGHQAGYANMVGNVPKLTQYTLSGSTPAVQLYVPLQFWFCRNPGLALPLIALQYHDVQVNMELRTFAECSNQIGTAISAVSLAANLYVDYIYLDTDERRRFAQVNHEYLIEQLQLVKENISSTTPQIKLLFNHPVKELIWIVQPDDHVTDGAVNNQVGGQQYFNYTDRLDITYFSGTPGDPLGGGMHDPYRGAFPLTGKTAVGEAVSAGSNANVPEAGDKNTVIGSLTQNTWENMILSNVGIHGGTSSEQLFNHTHTISSGTSGGTVSVNATANGDDGVHTHTSASHTHTIPASTSSIASAAALTTLSLYDSGVNPISDAYVELNGHKRFSKRKGRYFNLVQPYQHHKNCPATGINVYSFSLSPEEHQPSGTCNFSRIDDAKLVLTLTHSRASQARVYAVNYNVFRIMSGMGGLAYSN